jgi:hypothetical protein
MCFTNFKFDDYMKMNKLTITRDTNEKTIFLVGEPIGLRMYSTGHLEQDEYQITLLKYRKTKQTDYSKKETSTKMNMFYLILKINTCRISRI